MRTLRPRAGQEPAQAHTARGWESPEWEQGCRLSWLPGLLLSKVVASVETLHAPVCAQSPLSDQQ